MSSLSLRDAVGLDGEEAFPHPIPVEQTTKTSTHVRRAIADDLRAAAELQAALLPRAPVDVSGYAIAAATRSAGAVGGDYYDFHHSRGCLHFAIGDVTGAGTGAAMLATALRALVRAHWLAPEMSAAMRDINRTFHQSVPDDKFATLFLGRLETLSGALQFVNAGHNPGLIVRASGELERLTVGGTVVGGFSDVSYEMGCTTLGRGDTLLTTSDGISDLWSDLEASHRRLAEIVRSVPGDNVELVKNRILAEIGLPHVAVSDDSTLLVIRRVAVQKTA